jgi:hypothetical protein
VAEQLSHAPLRRACVAYMVAHLAEVSAQSPFFADLVPPSRLATLQALASGAQSNFLSCGCLLDDAREYLGMLGEALDASRLRHSEARERQRLEWRDCDQESRRAAALALAAAARFGPAPVGCGASGGDGGCSNGCGRGDGGGDGHIRCGDGIDASDRGGGGPGDGLCSSSSSSSFSVAAAHAHGHALAARRAVDARRQRLAKVDAAVAAQAQRLQAARHFLRAQEAAFAGSGAADPAAALVAEAGETSAAAARPAAEVCDGGSDEAGKARPASAGCCSPPAPSPATRGLAAAAAAAAAASASAMAAAMAAIADASAPVAAASVAAASAPAAFAASAAGGAAAAARPAFEPRYEWQPVLPGQSVPSGLEVSAFSHTFKGNKMLKEMTGLPFAARVS